MPLANRTIVVGKASPVKFDPIIFDWMNQDYLKIGVKSWQGRLY